VHIVGHPYCSKYQVPRDAQSGVYRGGCTYPWSFSLCARPCFHEEPDHSISMLYEGGNKVLQLPNQAYLLHSYDQLIMQLNTLENARCSISGPPHTCGRARREATGQTPSQPQWDTGYGNSLPRYQEGGSSNYPHSTPGPSHRAGTSASIKFPHWYYPLERYIRYGVDQAEHMVEGIRRIESRIDEFERMQTEIHTFIDS
jgi:hypothetical protein